MRITFLSPDDGLSGGVRVIATYASQLMALGHDVLVIHHDRGVALRDRFRALKRGENPFPKRERCGHVTSSGVPQKWVNHRDGIRVSDCPDADVVIATWWETAVWMARLPNGKGRKIHLIQGLETWFDEATNARVIEALKLPNKKICISGDLKQSVRATVGDVPIAVVPNAVDLKIFNRPPRTRNKDFSVGFIYATTAVKALPRYLEAIRLARLKKPSLRIVAFGAEAIDDRWPLPEGTPYHCRPSSDLMPQLYAQCDVWLFASDIDSFGLPILEAMACRTPVIGVPVGAAPDLLPEGGGELLPNNDVNGLADAIVRWADMTADEWHTRSQKAHTKAHAYGWGEAANLLLRQISAS